MDEGRPSFHFLLFWPPFRGEDTFSGATSKRKAAVQPEEEEEKSYTDLPSHLIYWFSCETDNPHFFLSLYQKMTGVLATLGISLASGFAAVYTEKVRKINGPSHRLIVGCCTT